jgi:ABC-2 type transport system ATP-binding protein
VPVTEPPDRISVPVAGGAVRLADVVRQLDLADVTAADVALRRPTLDEVFLKITGTQRERQAA